ncbi:MAG TPA: hypothetical protein VL500_00210 [Candidatus Eisenbacteria bacterium]|jgi:uncharacterized membrane protein (GlpM family)|nr:hypothetical protein [Candidatus Eisenbacteria bacterium]
MVAQVKTYIIYFLTGGAVTALIVGFERSNNRLLSGLATLVPVFTVVAYLFIGDTKGGVAVSQHAWLVLFGTIASWVPYMIAVALLAPKIGPHKAIPVGLAVFLGCALAYLEVVRRYRLFQ